MSRRNRLGHNIVPYQTSRNPAISETDNLVKTVWSLFAGCPVPAALIAAGSGRIVSYNHLLHRLTGYRKNNARFFSEWIVRLAPASDNRAAVLDRLSRSVRKGLDLAVKELVIVDAGGEKRCCGVNIKSIVHNKRKTGHLVMLMTEIPIQVSDKDRPAADGLAIRDRALELRKKEETFRNIFEAVNIGMWECDLSDGALNINPSLKNFLGYVWTDLNNVDKVMGIIPSEDIETFSRELSLHDKGLTDKFSVEHRVIHHDGGHAWMLSSGKIIERSDSGKPVKIIGTTQDISSIKTAEKELRDYRDHLEELVRERTDELLDSNKRLHREIHLHKKLKHELKESRQRLELALEGGDLGFWDFDILNKSMVLSDKWMRVFGCDPSLPSVPVRTLVKLIHPDDKTEIFAAQKRHVNGRDQFYESEHRMFITEGRWMWVHMKGKIVEYDSTGSPRRAAGTILDITQRKKIEARLQENEDRYWNLFNNMRSGVSIYDSHDWGKSFILKDFNRAGEIMDRVKKEEVIGKELSEIYGSADECGLRSLFERVFTSGLPEEKSSYYYSDDRISCWRSSYIHKLPSGELVLINEDLSEKKFAEEEVKKQEKKYKDLVENISEGICVIDDNSLTKFASPSLSGILGYTIEEMQGRPLDDFMSEHYVPICRIYFRRLEMGSKEQGDFEFIRKDGSLVYARMDFSPLKDSDGKYMGAIISVMDITEHKKVDEQLKRSGKLLASVFKSIQDQVIVIDQSFKVIMSNLRNDLSSRVTSQGDNSFCYRCLMNRAEPCEDCQAVEVFRTGKYKAFERVNFLGGRTYDVRMFPIMDDSGVVSMVVQHLRDITDKKNAEEKIRASLDEKEFLLKEIHHRVKNNMQIISSMLNLQSKYVTDIRDLDLFRDSQNRVRAMALVHEKLYQSSDLANIDFSLYIKEFCSYLFYSYNINPEKIGFDITVENVFFSIDKAIPLAQIINEVISNALKHAFPGDMTGRIEVVFVKKRNVYSLVIRDNGAGFPAGIDFNTAESLGLQLIHALVIQLEGEIVMRSEGGTEIEITFA